MRVSYSQGGSTYIDMPTLHRSENPEFVFSPHEWMGFKKFGQKVHYIYITRALREILSQPEVMSEWKKVLQKNLTTQRGLYPYFQKTSGRMTLSFEEQNVLRDFHRNKNTASMKADLKNRH